MSSDIAIQAINIGKRYEIYQAPHHRLFQTLTRNRKQFYKEFWALQNISLEAKRGECIGIIGENGCGKSTLLQIIANILNPTTGHIEIHGKVAALLELGSGFNPEFTGRENIYMNGTIMGFSKAQMDKRFDEIAAFADIGDFINQPVKYYSSGMYIRLAFAVGVFVDADILVIDEALAVGDAIFVPKCMRHLRRFKEKGTLLFVSHDLAAVRSLCDKVIWLKNGTIRAAGNAKEIADIYQKYVIEQTQKGVNPNATAETSDGSFMVKGASDPAGEKKVAGELRNRKDFSHMQITSVFDSDIESFGTRDAEIISVKLTDLQNKPLPHISGGEKVRFHVIVKAKRVIEQTLVGLFIRDRLGQVLAGDITESWEGFNNLSLPANVETDFVFEMTMPFFPSGTYTVMAGIGEGTAQGKHIYHHHYNEAVAFECYASSVRFGLAGIIPERVFWTYDSIHTVQP